MSLYDRERALSAGLNSFMHQRLGLPADDYYARLDARGMAELKSLLGDINNIFTLKVCLSFAAWLAGTFQLGDAERDAIRESILRKSKSRMDPARCLKFLVLLDTPEIRGATQQLVKTLKQYREAIVTLEAGMRPDSVEKLYVVHVAAG